MAGLHLQSALVSSMKPSELPIIVTGSALMSCVLRFLSSRLAEFLYWAERYSKEKTAPPVINISGASRDKERKHKGK